MTLSQDPSQTVWVLWTLSYRATRSLCETSHQLLRFYVKNPIGHYVFGTFVTSLISELELIPDILQWIIWCNSSSALNGVQNNWYWKNIDIWHSGLCFSSLGKLWPSGLVLLTAAPLILVRLSLAWRHTHLFFFKENIYFAKETSQIQVFWANRNANVWMTMFWG